MGHKINACATFFRDVFYAWSEDRAPRMGAALAYYTIFSLAPLLIISVAIAGLIFGTDAAEGQIVDQFRSTLGTTAAETVEQMVKNTSTPGGNLFFTIVGIVILLVGASGVFAELQDSLNTIWKVPGSNESGLWNTIRNRFLSFAMILGLGFLLLVSLVISALLAALNKFLTPESMPGGVLLWQAINALISFGFITSLIALIYKVLPDVKIAWRDVWVGAVITSLLFGVGKLLIGLYLAQTSTSSAYGAAGSLVVLLIWIYYSAQIFLFGAEFTHLYSQQNSAACVARAGDASMMSTGQRAPVATS